VRLCLTTSQTRQGELWVIIAEWSMSGRVRLVQTGSDGERLQRPLPVTLLVGPSTSGKTMCGLVDGPTMDTTARSVGEPQQSELVSQRVWSRVATFTEAPHVRLKCLQESAASERPRRSRRRVPLLRERGAGIDHSGP
jgi:hypothetical protein